MRIPQSTFDKIHSSVDRMGLPPVGNGFRFDPAPSTRAFFGRREDGKLMVIYSRRVPESMDNDADYHPLHGCVCATIDKEIIGDTLDDLIAQA